MNGDVLKDFMTFFLSRTSDKTLVPKLLEIWEDKSRVGQK